MKDTYVKFDGPAIKGESQDKNHKDWIGINNWSQAISQPRSVTASTAGDHTVECCEHHDMVFTKDLDVVSPLLYQRASGDTTFGEVTVEFFRADSEGNRVEYLEVKLENVILSEVDSQVMAQGILTGMFSLRYAAVQREYTQQRSAGGQGGNSQGTWNPTKNDKTYSVQHLVFF